MTALIIRLRIEHAAAAAQRARAALLELLSGNCPGPHEFQPHRDGLRPWCLTCRYQDNGQPVGVETRCQCRAADDKAAHGR